MSCRADARRTRCAPRAAFTLIEMLVVVAIIATLAGLVGPALLRNVGDSKASAARSQVESYALALDAYRLDNDLYPTSEQGIVALRAHPAGGESPRNWRGPYVTKVIAPDPWGRPYVYVSPGLDACVASCDFRLDLLHRLSGVVIEVPALHERIEDVPALLQHFALRLGIPAFQFSRAAIANLCEHDWPGNVRELRHVAERLSVIAPGRPVDGDDVNAALRRKNGGVSGVQIDSPLQQRLILELERHDGDTVEVARALDVHRATVYRWMARCRISATGAARGGGQAFDGPGRAAPDPWTNIAMAAIR